MATLKVNDTKLLKTFGNNMRELMQMEDMSFVDLARESGVSRTALLSYASAKQSPTLCAIVAIAQALDVQINDLIGVDIFENSN